MRVLDGMAAVLRDHELRPDDYRLHNHDLRPDDYRLQYSALQKGEGQSYSEFVATKSGLFGKWMAQGIPTRQVEQTKFQLWLISVKCC